MKFPVRHDAAIWMALVLAIPACSVGPQYTTPATVVNPDWRQADSTVTAQAAPDSAWWHEFGDTTLDRLVTTACAQNLSLQTAGARIMEARARLALAAGRQYPQVQALFANATAVGISDRAANSVLADHDFWDFQVGFDAEWEIDLWKKFGRGVQAETGAYFATVADYDDALVTLTAEVARAYTTVRTYEVLLEQARRNAAVQEEGLRIAQSRFRNGATSELDVTQAATLWESTRATIPQLEAGLIQSRNALCTLLGVPAGALDAMPAGATGIPAPTGITGVGLPAELIRRRPDIRRAEFQAYAQAARVGVAAADLYPSLSIAGSIGSQTSEEGGSMSGNASFADIFSPGSWFYSIGPRLFWPIFNYGRIRNSVRIEDAQLQQLLVEYQSAVLRAEQEVEDGLTGYRKAQESEVFSANAARQAERAVDLAMIQYREGAVDYQRVLDAERTLLQEQNTLTQTQSSIATNLIALYKALGGGWEVRNGQPFVSDRMREEMQKRTNWGNLFSSTPAPVHTGASTSTGR